MEIIMKKLNSKCSGRAHASFHLICEIDNCLKSGKHAIIVKKLMGITLVDFW